MTTTIRSIKITPTDTITTIGLNAASSGTEIAAAIDCDMFAVVDLTGSIDLFVDDEGLINGSTLNLPATVLAHLLGNPTVIFGTTIAVGTNPDGQTVGLTDSQLTRVHECFAQKLDPEIFDELVNSLLMFPTVVGMLGSI